MAFTFFSPTKIVFGQGRSRDIAIHAGELGRAALVITGKQTQRAAAVIADLEQAGISCTVFSQWTEPRVAEIALAAQRAGTLDVDFIVAVGGGSVLDAAKAISALVTNKGDIHDYLEVIGRGKPLAQKTLPLIALPTTAGTGAEVTCNAVLSKRGQGIKVSLRSPFLYPSIAIVDPLLTLSLPPRVTAETGMDALTQLIEAFVTPFSSPVTDALCREGLHRVSRSLKRAVMDGQDPGAREDMCIASLFGGMALANAKLGAVHGIAAPLGGMIDASHGQICARFLAPVAAINIRRLGLVDSSSALLEKYREVAVILTHNPAALPEDGVERIKDLVNALEIPSLKGRGLDAPGCRILTEKAMGASSMKGNCVALTLGEILDLVTGVVGISPG